MKNIYEVLRQKELEIKRLEKEIEALRIVAPMLADEKDASQIGTQGIPQPQAKAYSASQGADTVLAAEAPKPGRVWP
jgi:hypothetical protein